MEIKTITYQLDYADDFDRLVNEAIAEGWRLTRRDVLVPPTTDKYIMCYAELVKLDPPAEPETPDLLTAMRTIKETCSSVDSCEDCPAQPWCNFSAPHLWVLPEEVQSDG